MRSMNKRWSRLVMMASVAAIVALGLNVRVTEGDPGKGKKGTLDLFVNVDEASFDFVGLPENGFGARPGPFNIVGEFDGGTFRCWGWIDTNFAGSVSQVFDFPGRGSIMTQGIEGGFLAVTGGTGDFRNVRGEALQTFTDNSFDFTIEFDLKGAKK